MAATLAYKLFLAMKASLGCRSRPFGVGWKCAASRRPAARGIGDTPLWRFLGRMNGGFPNPMTTSAQGLGAIARGLDHIVHAVRDLDAAAATYGRLGFTVGARNRHPWGTHNRIIQLPGFFSELLTGAEPDKLGPDGFARLFGGFNRDFLTRHEGFPLLMLESHDAARDADLFRDAGIAASQALRFERQGERPDGTPVTVGFTLAFARDAAAPGAGFAICQQHFPENFWNPAFQAHANTASGVAGVVLVAENPSDHHLFLSAFAGERELLATSTRITVTTPRGTIQA